MKPPGVRWGTGNTAGLRDQLIRLVASSAVFLAVTAVFGAVHSWWGSPSRRRARYSGWPWPCRYTHSPPGLTSTATSRC